MFCEACRRYRPPRRDRPPAFCPQCGQPTLRPDRARLAADLDRLRYLLDELRSWVDGALIDRAIGDRLADPYRIELDVVGRCLERADAIVERPAPPECHDTPLLWTTFCPDCGVHLSRWRAQRTAELSPPVAEPPPPAVAPPPPVVAPPPPPPKPYTVEAIRGAKRTEETIK